MNLLQNILHRLVMACLLLIGMGCAVSCISDNEACPPDNENDGPFRISFNIVTRNIAGNTSRAADLEGQQIGSAAENYIDVNDIRCLIFDADQKFIVDVTPDADIKAENEQFTIYQVTARINHPYFLDNAQDRIGFYIMVLANYTDWGYTIPAMHTDVTIDDVFGHVSPLTMQPDAQALLNALNGGAGSQRFPMAGIQYFYINRNNLYNSSEDTPFNLSTTAGGKDINILRSLAKIEVIDHIDIGDDGFTDEDLTNPLRVAAVELDGFMNQGSLLPQTGQWTRNVTNIETQQVIATSIPATASYMRPPILNNDNTFGATGSLTGFSLPLAYDAVATAARTDKCPVYSCYVFEYNRDALAGTIQKPYFRVTTQGRESDTDPVAPLTLPMRLANYNDAAAGALPENIPALLRNHIYRYEIMAISQTITVNWTVCPMDNATINIGFN